MALVNSEVADTDVGGTGQSVVQNTPQIQQQTQLAPASTGVDQYGDPTPSATYGSFIPNPGAFQPQGINSFGGVTNMNATGYNAAQQQYLNSPQAYQAAFVGLNPNTAFQTYGQSANLLNQSLQPGFNQQLQQQAAQAAGNGIFNSSATGFNQGNLQAQQDATLAGQYGSLLNTAQNQYGQLQQTGYQGAINQNQFNTGAQNTASLAGYQGLLGQMGANQSAVNSAGEYNASANNAASQFNATNANTAAGQDQSQYNQWLSSLQNEQFGLGNAALEQYLSAFGDTSSAGILGQAGSGATSAYNNAFNAQNSNNNIWSTVLGQGLGAAGTAFSGKP